MGFLCSMYICYELYVRFTYPYHGYDTCLLSLLYDLFRYFVNPWALHYLFILLGVLDVKGSVSNLAEGSLNTLPGFSLFVLVLMCIFSRLVNGNQWSLFEWWWLFRRQVYLVCLRQFLVDGQCEFCFVGEFWFLGEVVWVLGFVMFFLGLFQWISLYLLWFLFLELCICLLHCFLWMGPLSLQKRSKCYLQYRT